MSASSVGMALQPVLGAISAIPGVQRSPAPYTPAKPFAPQASDTRQDLDAKIARLQGSAKSWVDQSPRQRIALLQKVMDLCLEVGPLLASDCVQAKGSYGGGQGEET